MPTLRINCTWAVQTKSSHIKRYNKKSNASFPAKFNSILSRWTFDKISHSILWVTRPVVASLDPTCKGEGRAIWETVMHDNSCYRFCQVNDYVLLQSHTPHVHGIVLPGSMRAHWRCCGTICYRICGEFLLKLRKIIQRCPLMHGVSKKILSVEGGWLITANACLVRWCVLDLYPWPRYSTLT